jgi:hypothetical protein
MAITGAIAAVGTAATGVVGSIMNRGAAGKAAEAQQRYLQEGREFQEGVYEDATTNMTPWIHTGQQAVDALGQFAGLQGHGGAAGSGALASYHQFEQTPYYTFPLAQNVATMDRAAAAKGMSLSEGQLASLGKYAGNYSSQNFGTYISALQNLSGLGASTAGNLGNIGNQTAALVGDSAGRQATTAGAGIMGTANENSALMNSLGNLFRSVGGAANGMGGSNNDTGSSYGGLGNTYGAGLLSGATGTNIGSGPPIGTSTITPYWNGMMQGASWR